MNPPELFRIRPARLGEVNRKATNGEGSVEPFEAFVEGPRARGAFVLRLEMDGEWSIQVADEAMLTVLAVLEGSCSVTTASAASRAVAGDVVVVRGPGPYSVSSDPERSADFIIPPNQTCIDVHGDRLVESMRRGVRTWGTTEQGRDRFLVGTYADPLEIGRLSVQLLPELLVEATDASTRAFADLLASEAATDAPGQPVVLDRLLDALLVAALRAAGPGIARQGDPLIDRVIEQLHANPRRPLSVEAMARSGALSRAAFSQRFSRRTGLGPGAYQRRLRLAWAADELRATARTVAAVGEEAGYGSPASFSSAFKQEYGQSPHGWRTRGGRGADRVY